jgi:hypothetical protein
MAAALAVGVSACGSASSSSSTAAASAGTSVSSSSARYQARVNLAKCFRAHGINVPDPSPNGGVPEGIGKALQSYSQSQIDAARQACQQYLTQAFPQLNLTPAQQAQFRQQFVKWAECMRSHGIDIPDPSTSGGGFGLRRSFGSVDRNSPAFQSASTACQSLRPKFGRGGAGAPGGGPSA